MEKNRDFVSTILFERGEKRLRSGWRLLIQTVLLIVFLLCFTCPLTVYLAMAGTIHANDLNFGADFLLPMQIAQTLAFTLSVFLAVRFLDKRPFSSLGLTLNKKALWDVIAGIAITFLMMGLIFGIELSIGWIRLERFAWETQTASHVAINLVLFLAIFILTAWGEEILSRGYHLQTIANGTNKFWGILISSVIFGLLHIGNPDATWVSVAGIFVAGLFFAFGYYQTNRLWLPIGIHLGWNYFEGVVFGFPVSGLDIYRLIEHQTIGPALWTGGPFGPEAGLIMLPALALGIILVYGYAKLGVRP